MQQASGISAPQSRGRPENTTMKTSLKATLTCCTLAGFTALAFANDRSNDKGVNAYGEPAGFSNTPSVVVTPPAPGQDVQSTSAVPGLAGLYPIRGNVDRRNFESLGAWQERKDAELQGGSVNIGALEILDSGPTGPLDENSQAAATSEVTGQVLTRINATDKTMSALKSRAASLDGASRERFKAAADEVAVRRQALREDLKNVRQADGTQWAAARATLASSFNAYVQAQHRAEEVAAAAPTNA